MKIEKFFTKDSEHKNIFDSFEWKLFDVQLKDHRSNKTIYEIKNVEAPAHWSQQAVDITASKYFRRSGIPFSVRKEAILPDGVDFPKKDIKQIPEWILPSVSADIEGTDVEGNGETSIKQIFHRLAGAWTYWGWISGFFKSDDKANSEIYAKNFYDEVVYCLYHQMAAPNSPQFFNTGIWWAYGIKGKACGHTYTDKNGKILESTDLYSRSQAHACFILGLEDNLLDEDGIYDLLKKEARIFKLGSGSGTNFSKLRAEGEPLSGGGTSSGLMSFLRIFDRAADCIKSGGVTRRAAKMLVANCSHPDIFKYVNWKSEEEKKAKTLIAGGYEADFNGEAYRTISGQNGNNSVAVDHAFMKALEEDKEWSTWWCKDQAKYRKENGEIDWDKLKSACAPASTFKASKLWDAMNESAWKCADPAVLFTGTMNDWNTLKSDGTIECTNPCGEHVSLVDTACNLSSINVSKFYDNKNRSFDVEGYKHSVRLFQMILEITNHMAQLPSNKVAYNVWQYRNTGLGMANLGTLLMLMGYSYESEEGRSVAASLAAILTGHSYATSAEMAEDLGPFAAYDRNREHMLRAVKNHRRAAYGLSKNLEPTVYRNLVKQVGEYEGLKIHPVILSDKESYSQLINSLIFEARKSWDSALSLGSSFGYRNCQVSVMAPTGTLSFIMDCDATGIEPCYALVTYKTLAGGGVMKLTNKSVEQSLRNLKYNSDEIEKISNFVKEFGHVKGSGIKSEHESIFNCAASPLGNEGVVSWKSHIEMLASIQAFVSAGISKTINMPESATKEDISEALKLGYRLGAKGVSVYRDNCKGSSPLTTTKPKKEEFNIPSNELAGRITNDDLISELTKRKIENSLEIDEMLERLGITSQDIDAAKKHWGERRRPGDVLPGMRFRIKIGQAQGYVQIFIYPNGRMCEFFLTFGNPGSSLNNMLECWSIAFSVALQRGESLYNLCSKFIGVEFEPKGFTGRKDDLRKVSSPVDYIVRLMLMYFDNEGFIKDPSMFQQFISDANEPTKEYQPVKNIETNNEKDETSDNTSSINRPPCPKCGSIMTAGTNKCPTCAVCGFFGGCG